MSYAHAAGTPQVGAYRNLTAAFLRYRDASRAHSRPFKGAPALRCHALAEVKQP